MRPRTRALCAAAPASTGPAEGRSREARKAPGRPKLPVAQAVRAHGGARADAQRHARAQTLRGATLSAPRAETRNTTRTRRHNAPTVRRADVPTLAGGNPTMQTPQRAQMRDIAARVHTTFDARERWHQVGWGYDDEGEFFAFKENAEFVKRGADGAIPALRTAAPDSLRCFCLGAAIRIQTAAVLGHDPREHVDATEAVCALYARIGRIDPEGYEGEPAVFEPWLDAVVQWNDEDVRTFEEVRALTEAVVHHLDAQAREDVEGA